MDLGSHGSDLQDHSQWVFGWNWGSYASLNQNLALILYSPRDIAATTFNRKHLFLLLLWLRTWRQVGGVSSGREVTKTSNILVQKSQLVAFYLLNTVGVFSHPFLCGFDFGYKSSFHCSDLITGPDICLGSGSHPVDHNPFGRSNNPSQGSPKTIRKHRF